MLWGFNIQFMQGIHNYWEGREKKREHEVVEKGF